MNMSQLNISICKYTLLEMKLKKEFCIRGYLSSEFAFGSLRDGQSMIFLFFYFFWGGGSVLGGLVSSLAIFSLFLGYQQYCFQHFFFEKYDPPTEATCLIFIPSPVVLEGGKVPSQSKDESGQKRIFFVAAAEPGECTLQRVCDSGSGAPLLSRQCCSIILSYYCPIFPPSCSPMSSAYIILYYPNIMLLRYSLSFLPLQVHLHSVLPILLVAE